MSRAERLNAQPDAELLQLCREFHRIRASARDVPLDDIEQFCALFRIQRAITDIILDVPHCTDAGRKAKAGVAIAMLADGVHPADA